MSVDRSVSSVIRSRLDESELGELAKRAVTAQLGDPATADATGEPTTAPGRTYLSSIEVTGFRGIGATAVLDIEPGPGMRVVQLTPPGSPCSVVIGQGMPLGEPGSTRGPRARSSP